MASPDGWNKNPINAAKCLDKASVVPGSLSDPLWILQGGARSSFKWDYNLHKQPYTWVTGIFSRTYRSYNPIYHL